MAPPAPGHAAWPLLFLMTMLRMTMSDARISIFTIRDIIMILFLIATLGVLGDDAHVSHMRYTKE